ncbi:MAG: MFS transporter [Acidobacteriota bacterium]|jgi:predicted MFS family arabinose efflux permease|nr:MFS transporter [Acidobacteriota bacterium]
MRGHVKKARGAGDAGMRRRRAAKGDAMGQAGEGNERWRRRLRVAMWLFAAACAFTGFYTGVTDSVLANYFKDAYDVTARQRGFIEFPRETPGVLSLLVISALAFLKDIRTAIVAQILGAVGLVVLGLWHPSYAVMLAFLFIFSLGQHMFMPLGDSIGLSLARRENMGRVLGRFNSVRMAFGMLAGLVCFFGFRWGFLDFETPVLIFLVCAACFALTGALLYALHRTAGRAAEEGQPPAKLVFRKEYMRYYVLCALFGGRKQIMYVFSPWVLIDLLDFKADVMSILAVVGSFIGVFFLPFIGRLIDRMGARKVMMIEAAAFVAIYVAYGGLSKWVDENAVVLTGAGMLLVYLLNIIDKMCAQFYMVRSIYMKAVARTPEDVTPSLSAGMAIDHVLAILGSALCGLVWAAWGPEYVFLVAGLLSLANFVVAAGIPETPRVAGD